MNLKITRLKLDVKIPKGNPMRMGSAIRAGGEGSRGGNVIGHTGLGKPIYRNAQHASHDNFTATDHKEAVDAHQKIIKNIEEEGQTKKLGKRAQKLNLEETEHHNRQIGHHEKAVG